MKLIAISMISAALLAQGGSVPGVHVWKATQIHDRGNALAKKLDANKLASEVIATEGNRAFVVSHREASGQAEVHDAQADIIFISEGSVTMVYGGTVVDGKETAPGETRGSGITGGVEVNLGQGDVLHIPAKVPHQMKLAPRTQVTYFVAKVTQ